jgi:AcrR family transcriptional regulator
MTVSRRDENAEATRKAVIKSAKRIFGKRGYAQTTLEAISRDARVTTGAIYHHFGGKERLFRTVAEDVEAALLSVIAAAAGKERDAWDSLTAGIEAFFDSAASVETRQIIFIDAPRVIGPAEWRAIEAKYAFGLMKAGVAALIKEGKMKPFAPDIAASVLLSALIEAANLLAQAKGSPEARLNARHVIEAMLSGLRP